MKVDLVEDVLQQCKRNAEERKKKILAAYEAASRSGPAGVVKGVDFEPFIKADGKLVVSIVQTLTTNKSLLNSLGVPTHQDGQWCHLPNEWWCGQGN